MTNKQKKDGNTVKFWGLIWSHDRGLNPRPHPYHGCALPTELSRHLICYFYARVSSRTIQDKFVAYYDSALPTELSRQTLPVLVSRMQVLRASYFGKLLLDFNIFTPLEASYLRRRVLLALDSGFGRFGATNASNSAQAIPFTK